MRGQVGNRKHLVRGNTQLLRSSDPAYTAAERHDVLNFTARLFGKLEIRAKTGQSGRSGEG